jgi:hypothetical protein
MKLEEKRKVIQAAIRLIESELPQTCAMRDFCPPCSACQANVLLGYLCEWDDLYRFEQEGLYKKMKKRPLKHEHPKT